MLSHSCWLRIEDGDVTAPAVVSERAHPQLNGRNYRSEDVFQRTDAWLNRTPCA